MRRVLFCFILMASVFLPHVFSEEVSVAIVRNGSDIGFDETAFIERKCSALFDAKRFFNEADRRHFLGKPLRNKLLMLEDSVRSAYSSESEASLASALAALEEFNAGKADVTDEGSIDFDEGLKLSFSVVSFQGKFAPSRLLAEKVAMDNKCDYMLVPLSEAVGSNLVRVRLLFFSVPEDSFSVVYDEMMSISEIEGFISANLPKLLVRLVSPDYGIVDFVRKDYGARIELDGEECKLPCIVKSGVHDASVSAEGYDTSDFRVTVMGGVANTFDFDLSMKSNSGLFIDGNGFSYNAFSSDIGAFTLPYFFEEYRTPSSISFSYPGFDTRYISLVGGVKDIGISLKPSYLSEPAYADGAMKRFYKSMLVALGIFAIDVTSRAFLDGHPDSVAWNSISKTSSYLGYFSISCILFNMFEYYFSSIHAFE